MTPRTALALLAAARPRVRRCAPSRGFDGPLQLQMGSPDLGGADTGKREYSIPKERLLAIFKRDLDRFHGMLAAAGW